MTLEEKVGFLSGAGMWRTAAIGRLGIAPIVMTDGTYGVRYSIPQIDGNQRGGEDLDAFLSVVSQRASDVTIAWGEMKSATCFPNGSAMGNSWDVALMGRLGELLGQECRALGVHLLLGPGINLRRTPLAGRAYEYYSEDPLLTGKLAGAVIRGLQSQGVGASLKHFAANNSEIERTTMDSVIDARALREIYLKGFEIAVTEAEPWTVMSSYNRLNGVQAAENSWLLDEVLRREWGYDGVVVSDWHGIKDRPASLRAGNDLDMPESPLRKADLLRALKAGSVSTKLADAACARVLRLIRRAQAAAAGPVPTIDAAAHHAEARRLARESMVLVKNEGLLPIRPEMRSILVVGHDGVTPVIQGSGCATTTPTFVDQPLDELRAALWPEQEMAFRDETDAETLRLAAEADLVIFFASTEGAYDGEGADRTTLALGPGQDAAISALGAVTARLAVVIACPDAVEMPWIDAAGAVLVTFYSGQAMGGAVADLLVGRVSPSGKLSVTFPRKLGDVPGYLSYPGELGRHLYAEGIHTGYRGYARRGTEVLFPFGHGIGYASFAYSGLALSAAEVGLESEVAVSFTITNAGDMAAAEVSQLYLAARGRVLQRSPLELKGFAKTPLAPGESRRVTIALSGRGLAVWDPRSERWELEGEAAELLVGASSADIRLRAPLRLLPSVLPWRRIAYDTQPLYVLENPIARAEIRGYLSARAGISEVDADRALDHCANSFFGIFTTLERRLRISIPKDQVAELLVRINHRMDQETAKSDADKSASA
ncbi:MAG: glycosyl hydrolase [Rhodobacteraceae bacterium]|nr:glycosyl hydrolase [Paracoccaceae bacterium]